jgi:protein MAK11
MIKIYDLQTKQQKSEIFEHEGSITALSFFRNQYLLSGSLDGVTIIWRIKDWSPLHKLRVRNVSPVKHISIHPSGRMALVIYGNNMLRLWNLLDARCVYKCNLCIVRGVEQK